MCARTHPATAIRRRLLFSACADHRSHFAGSEDRHTRLIALNLFKFRNSMFNHEGFFHPTATPTVPASMSRRVTQRCGLPRHDCRGPPSNAFDARKDYRECQAEGAKRPEAGRPSAQPDLQPIRHGADARPDPYPGRGQGRSTRGPHRAHAAPAGEAVDFSIAANRAASRPPSLPLVCRAAAFEPSCARAGSLSPLAVTRA